VGWGLPLGSPPWGRYLLPHLFFTTSHHHLLWHALSSSRRRGMYQLEPARTLWHWPRWTWSTGPCVVEALAATSLPEALASGVGIGPTMSTLLSPLCPLPPCGPFFPLCAVVLGGRVGRKLILDFGF